MFDQKTIDFLKQFATRECWSDDEEFNPYDFSGGNFDDAYEGGYADGQAHLAQELLAMVGIATVKPTE